MEKKETYMPPVVELILVEIEKGLAASRTNGTTNDMDIEELAVINS